MTMIAETILDPIQAAPTPSAPSQADRLKNVPRCGAKTRKGTPCESPAMSNGRCRMHGGSTPKGIASASFKHGKYSAHMPAPLAERHEAGLADLEAIKSLNEDIVVLHNLICDRLEALQTGERGNVWSDLQGLVWDAEQEGATLESILPRLQAIASKGKETAQAEREIIALIHNKAKITATEAKRQADSSEMASREEVKTRLMQIVGVVRDHVQDQATLRAIANDLAVIWNGKQRVGATPVKAIPAGDETG